MIRRGLTRSEPKTFKLLRWGFGVNTPKKLFFNPVTPESQLIRVSDRDRTGDLQGHNLAL